MVTVCSYRSSYAKDSTLLSQVAQLSQRDRVVGLVSLWPKVKDWNWETIFTDNIQPLRRIWPAEKSKSAKKAK